MQLRLPVSLCDIVRFGLDKGTLMRDLFVVVQHLIVSAFLLCVAGCQEATIDIQHSSDLVQTAALAKSRTDAKLSVSHAELHATTVDEIFVENIGGERSDHAKMTEGNSIAVFDETDFNFGEMDPYTFGQHSFRVTNRGSVPLVLELGESTCNCTVSSVPDDPILPGKSAEVLLRWQTSKNNQYFLEESTIRTNDPNQSVVALRIRGHVRVHFGASPPQFDFHKVAPGKRASVTSLLSSQVWPSFEIEDVRSSMPGIQWEVSEPRIELLEDIKAKSGKHLTVTIPDYLQQGAFSHWLRVMIQPEGGKEATEYELPLVGKVVRPVSVYGKCIDSTGTIRLGVISSHVGCKRRFLVKVRDKQTSLLVRETKTVPGSLVVQLHAQDVAAGLYVLEIEVPKHSKPCDYISKSDGLIRLDFEHPRIDALELKMEFAVADRPPTR